MSCTTQTLLASVDSTRFLTRCTCGCLHLVWDNATLRLDERDLGGVVRRLRGSFSASEDDVQVWLLSAGLRFSRAEFTMFREMLGAGLTKLTRQPTSSPAETPRACTLLN